MARSRHLPVLLLAATVVLLQGTLSLFGRTYLLTQVTMACYYGLVVIGLCMLIGYAGQISIGHAAFFAIGGYTNAVLTTSPLEAGSGFVRLLTAFGGTAEGTDMYGERIVHLSPVLALACAILMAAVVALAIGIPILRLKGHYLAMATLGFGIIVSKVLIGAKSLGGADGIIGVPAFPLAPGLAISGERSARILNYYVAWGALAAGLVLLLNLIHSRVGRALRAIHGNEPGAQSVGIDTARLKLQVFVLSAVFAAVGGALMTHFNGSIGPSEAGIAKSVRYVAIVAVGGMANLWGALLMGLFLNFLSLRGWFGSFDEAVFGLIMIAIMMFFPDGLLRKPRAGVLLQRWTRRTP
jgi:branched-chain amino acid transport system permease protein